MTHAMFQCNVCDVPEAVWNLKCGAVCNCVVLYCSIAMLQSSMCAVRIGSPRHQKQFPQFAAAAFKFNFTSIRRVAAAQTAIQRLFVQQWVLLFQTHENPPFVCMFIHVHTMCMHENPPTRRDIKVYVNSRIQRRCCGRRANCTLVCVKGLSYGTETYIST